MKGTSRSGDFFSAGSRTSRSQRCLSVSALTLFMSGHYSPRNFADHETGPGQAPGGAGARIRRSLSVVSVSYYVSPSQREARRPAIRNGPAQVIARQAFDRRRPAILSGWPCHCSGGRWHWRAAMIRTRTLAAIGTAVLLLGSPLFAQPSSSNSSKQLVVTSASVDRTERHGHPEGLRLRQQEADGVLRAHADDRAERHRRRAAGGVSRVGARRHVPVHGRARQRHERARNVLRDDESPADSRGPAGSGRGPGPEGRQGRQGRQGRHGRAGRARSPWRARAAGREGRSGPAGFQRRHRRERTSGSRRSPGATGSGRTARIGGAAGRRRANRSAGRAGPDRTNWTGWSAGCSRHQRLRAHRRRQRHARDEPWACRRSSRPPARPASASSPAVTSSRAARRSSSA